MAGLENQPINKISFAHGCLKEVERYAENLTCGTNSSLKQLVRARDGLVREINTIWAQTQPLEGLEQAECFDLLASQYGLSEVTSVDILSRLNATISNPSALLRDRFCELLTIFLSPSALSKKPTLRSKVGVSEDETILQALGRNAHMLEIWIGKNRLQGNESLYQAFAAYKSALASVTEAITHIKNYSEQERWCNARDEQSASR